MGFTERLQIMPLLSFPLHQPRTLFGDEQIDLPTTVCTLFLSRRYAIEALCAVIDRFKLGHL